MSAPGAHQRGRSCPTGRRREVRTFTCDERDVSGAPPLSLLLKRVASCLFRKMSLSGTCGALSMMVKTNVQTWPPIDEGWWRDKEVLPSICELKTKEVTGHDREQHEASDG